MDPQTQTLQQAILAASPNRLIYKKITVILIDNNLARMSYYFKWCNSIYY